MHQRTRLSAVRSASPAPRGEPRELPSVPTARTAGHKRPRRSSGEDSEAPPSPRGSKLAKQYDGDTAASAAASAVSAAAPSSKLAQAIQDAAQELSCPLTQELPRDPVTAQDGRIYERKAIERWLRTSSRSPVTNTELVSTAVYASPQVRNLIESMAESGALHAQEVAEWRADRDALERGFALRRRAERGIAADCSELAVIHLKGREGEEVSTKEWHAWALKAARAETGAIALNDERYSSPRAPPSFMRSQLTVTGAMRAILVDWLAEVNTEFQLQTRTLFLAVNYIDRYLGSVPVAVRQLQLVGAACLRLAEGISEGPPLALEEYSYISDETYTTEELAAMERAISTELRADLCVATARTFLERLLPTLAETLEGPHKPPERAHHDVCSAAFLAKYLAELTLLEPAFARHPPMMVAAAAARLAQHTVGGGLLKKAEPALTRYSGYVPAELCACVRELLALFRKHSANAKEPAATPAIMPPAGSKRTKHRESKLRALYDKYSGAWADRPAGDSANSECPTYMRVATIAPPAAPPPRS